MVLIQKIKAIGKKGVCSEIELKLFLPNYPSLNGSEFIFTIGWANSKKYIDLEIEDFAKGLHLIEEKYKLQMKNEFGFGSPSPTFKVIKSLSKQDFEKALELEEWVALNGGNYYISKVSNPESFHSRLTS